MFRSNETPNRSVQGEKNKWQWYQNYVKDMFFHFAWNLVCGLTALTTVKSNC